MKNPITILLIMAAMCYVLPLVWGSTRSSDLSPEVGRFVLESGEYLAPSHAAERRLPGIFKIDTATGRVWKYTPRLEGTETIEEWSLISE